MAISLRLNEEDENLIKKYAEIHGVTMSEFIRQSVIERIEDEYDLETYYKSLEEFKKNPITYSHEEVWKDIEIDR